MYLTVIPRDEALAGPILGPTPEILMAFERTLLAIVQPGLRTID